MYINLKKKKKIPKGKSSGHKPNDELKRIYDFPHPIQMQFTNGYVDDNFHQNPQTHRQDLMIRNLGSEGTLVFIWALICVKHL